MPPEQLQSTRLGHPSHFELAAGSNAFLLPALAAERRLYDHHRAS